MLVASRRAAGIQASSAQGVRHAEAIEHAADADDAEAPERTFTVDADQLLEAAQLVSSSWVKVEFAAFPARPGVGGNPEQCAASTWVSAPSARRSSTRSSSEPLAGTRLYVTSRSTCAGFFHPP